MMIAPGGPPNLNLICSLCYYKYIFIVFLFNMIIINAMCVRERRRKKKKE